MITNTVQQSFEVSFGRPTVKLQLQYSHVKRKFNIHEPYQVELDKPIESERQQEEPLITVEDQVRLR